MTVSSSPSVASTGAVGWKARLGGHSRQMARQASAIVLPRVATPKPNCPVIGLRGELATVERKRDRCDNPCVSFKADFKLPRRGIPEPDCCIVTCGGEQAPVRRPRHAINPIGVRFERAAHLPRRGVPERTAPSLLAEASRRPSGDHTTLLTSVRVSFEADFKLPRRGVPEPDCCIVTSGGEQAPVRRPRHAKNPDGVPFERAAQSDPTRRSRTGLPRRYSRR